MTMDDAFDARLSAAFAKAAEPLQAEGEADAFSHRVVKQLASPDRKRILILGGAGSTGSAIAGTQLESMLGQFQVPADGLMANIGFLLSPEVMAAGAMAVAVAMVAVVLPRRIV